MGKTGEGDDGEGYQGRGVGDIAPMPADLKDPREVRGKEKGEDDGEAVGIQQGEGGQGRSGGGRRRRRGESL